MHHLFVKVGLVFVCFAYEAAVWIPRRLVWYRCPLHMSCTFIGLEAEWYDKTFECSYCAHIDAEKQKSFINCNSCDAPVPGEGYVLGMHKTLCSRSPSELDDLLLHHSFDFLG